MLKNKSKRGRFAEVRNMAKGVQYCQRPGYGCGTPVSKIKVEIKKTTCAINIVSESIVPGDEAEGGENTKKKLKQILTPEMCYDILDNISDNDCLILGIDPRKSRPRSMIQSVFPVPPVPVRPSAKVDFMDSSSKEDDLTHKLADIIKANTRIRRLKESSGDASNAKYTLDHTHLLQYHVATYLDNESLTLPRAEQRNKPSKSLMSRLKGKEGRVRSNLMGNLYL
jgi:DNA-directed RNA polymerase II subunit RPB1